MSMVDGKMADYLQGDSGSPCHYCDFNTEGINNLLNILNGFYITKSYEICSQIWENVEEGLINWGDATRAGQCHKPLMELIIHGITHWKLRTFDTLLLIYYRLIAGVLFWDVSDSRLMPFINAAKKHAIDFIRRETGILIDTPTSDGGNTNAGNLAESFLDPNIREKVCSLINNVTHRENFEVLMRDVNIILTVTQSPRGDVKTQKLRQLGIDIMSHMRTNFLNENGQPWISINPSLHDMCAHSWELYEFLNKPIGIYSEQAQECWNKHVARFKSGCATRARQHSIKANTEDIFSRMLVMTHPVVASKRRQITCSLCGKEGHSAKSVKFHGFGPSELEKAMIEDYYQVH